MVRVRVRAKGRVRAGARVGKSQPGAPQATDAIGLGIAARG